MQFKKTKKKIIGRVRPHIRTGITDRTINGTSSSSSIEQKSTPSASETSDQEDLNALRYHRHLPPKKLFQKNHLKQNQEFDHRNTHHQNQKQRSSNYQDEYNCCVAKGHIGNECRRRRDRTCSKHNKIEHVEG